MKFKILICLIITIGLGCSKTLEMNWAVLQVEDVVGTWTEMEFSCENKSYAECSKLVFNADGTFSAINYSVEEHPLSIYIISETKGTWELITEGQGILGTQSLRISIERYKDSLNTYHDILYFNAFGQLYGGVDDIYIMYQKDN